MDYSPLKGKSLWELFPAKEPNTTSLDKNFLNNEKKAVLLFLELKKEGLRNCSPNNCDDKGAAVTATVRRLLIKEVDDLGKIIAESNKLGTGLRSNDLQTALLVRLNLPDLRLPRYDVPSTNPVTSKQVLAAFHAVFHRDQLAHNTGNALIAAYQAFKPMVQDAYPANPFADFNMHFGFLDNTPTTTTQVRFLQYYYDFFDDLIKAYDEFRWKGVELMCTCCPPEGLFSRHLMLGLLFPASVSNPSIYRHHFLASSAIGGCEERAKELLQLFRRMVEMIVSFTNTPPLLLDLIGNPLTDIQTRVTPSKMGGVTQSDKAIPYYYLQNGTPPLFQLWNVEKTRKNKANQNLSYRSYEYTPAAPAFVTDALAYDLEPYNFLRIEGHLGKNYQRVLRTLLSMKLQYRLPIEVIALRTGAFDENIKVDLSKEECRFQDLETLYDTLREELLCTLCEGVMYFYDVPIKDSNLDGGIPQLLLLKKYAPNFLYKKGTVGAWYEKNYELVQSRPYIDVDQNKVGDEVIKVYCLLFTGTADLPVENFAHIVSVYYLTKLAEILPLSLTELSFADFENKYQDLKGLIRFFRDEAEDNISDDFRQFIPQEDLIDHFDQVLFSCKLEPIKAIHEEYLRRIREVKQKQFLSYFLQKNPGIQHKAGVPFGGTFIIVYHDEPVRLNPGLNLDQIRANIIPASQSFVTMELDTTAIADAFARVSANPQLAIDPDIRFLLGSFTGQVPDLNIVVPPSEGVDKIIEEAVKDFADGTVIADFYLPYLCCSNCSPVQFVLPKTPPTFSVQIGCTSTDNRAEITVKPEGGLAPYTFQLDSQPFQALTDKLVLTVGTHTLVIVDSTGAESAPQSLTVPGPLTFGAGTFIDDVSAKTYLVSFNISGGTPPYKAASGTIKDNIYTSDPVRSTESIQVKITDNIGCTISKEFKHTICILPCEGQSRRCAYRLWVRSPEEGAYYKTYKQESNIKFRFNDKDIELPGTNNLLRITASQLNGNFQDTIGSFVKKLNNQINKALVDKLGPSGNNRLVITYKPDINDPMEILWIEYFVCDTFNIELNYSFAKPAAAFSLTFRYTNEPIFAGTPFNGTVLINRGKDDKKTRVPAFNCSERNQCSGSDYKRLCEGPEPKPSIKITLLENNHFQFEGHAENKLESEKEIIAWVWDVSTAQPKEPFYEGQKVQAELQQQGGTVKLVVITQQGCFGKVFQKITP